VLSTSYFPRSAGIDEMAIHQGKFDEVCCLVENVIRGERCI
jgi:hypothetical protein